MRLPPRCHLSMFVCSRHAVQIVFKSLQLNSSISITLQNLGIRSYNSYKQSRTTTSHNDQTRLLLNDPNPLFIAVARKQELKCNFKLRKLISHCYNE
jgi:hypothetical protein